MIGYRTTATERRLDVDPTGRRPHMLSVEGTRLDVCHTSSGRRTGILRTPSGCSLDVNRTFVGDRRHRLLGRQSALLTRTPQSGGDRYVPRKGGSIGRQRRTEAAGWLRQCTAHNRGLTAHRGTGAGHQRQLPLNGKDLASQHIYMLRAMCGIR